MDTNGKAERKILYAALNVKDTTGEIKMNLEYFVINDIIKKRCNRESNIIYNGVALPIHNRRSDFLTKIGLYEIKLNYKDNKQLIIEEYTNINEKLGKVSLGWIYKTKADLVVSISKNTGAMVFLPMTTQFKEYYESIKESKKLFLKKVLDTFFVQFYCKRTLELTFLLITTINILIINKPFHKNIIK